MRMRALLTKCGRSILLIEPLLSEEAKQLDIWKCWLKHRTLLLFCLRHWYDTVDVEQQISALVDDYLFAFDQVMFHEVTTQKTPYA